MVWIKIHRRSDASRRLTRKIYLVSDGPYQVLRIIRKNAYLLGDLEGEPIGTANSRQLKPHREAMLYQQQEDAQSEDPSEEGINYVHYNESRRRGRRNQLPRQRECRTCIRNEFRRRGSTLTRGMLFRRGFTRRIL